MKPYYTEPGIQLFCGDSRELVPQIDAESIITDPVWPNNSVPQFADIDPFKMLAEALVASQAKRIVIHYGCDSDPRYLQAAPSRYPFLRACWLEYVCPHYKGRVLYTSDVAYCFGEAPPSKEGAHVLPGKVVSTVSDRLFKRKTGRHKAEQLADIPHPTPRRLQHVRWLCKWFGGASACDPFMGGGTTAVACKALGIPFIGIDRESAFLDLTIERLAQGSFVFEEDSAA